MVWCLYLMFYAPNNRELLEAILAFTCSAAVGAAAIVDYDYVSRNFGN